MAAGKPSKIGDFFIAMLAKLRYSVNGVLYIDWALGEGSSSLNTRQQTIIPKLADYGHYAQPYLSRQNGWTIGTSYAEMATYVTQSYDYDTGSSESYGHYGDRRYREEPLFGKGRDGYRRKKSTAR